MKYLKYIVPLVIIVIAIVLGVLSFLQCEDCKPKTYAHDFLIDITDDTRVNIPDPISVADGYPFQKNIFNGAVFRLKTISSIHFTEVHEVELKKGVAITGNEVTRVVEVNNFFESISENISSLLNNNGGTSHSVILKPLMEELDYLSKLEEVEEKALFVYSDLKEHSPDGALNLYQASTINTLFVSPDNIREKIEQQVTVPKQLDGIVVHFLYQSDVMEEVRTFEAMASILKELLEEHDAKVFIHSQLKMQSDGTYTN